MSALLAAFVALMLLAPAATANLRPIAAYSFDEGSGSTLSDSARNHNGTITGATWTSSGKYGSALDFDGTDDVVRIVDANDLDLTGSFTIEAWVRPDAFSLYSPVLVKDDPGGTNGYLLSVNVGGTKPGAIIANNATYAIPSAPSQLPSATWSHLALTSDGRTLSFYVDGELRGSVAAIRVPASAYDLLIGHYSGSGAFDGMIDEVRLYDQALTQSQIEADRDSAVGLDQIPIAAYSFDEGSGTTLTDSAGNHNGTISGATWTSSGKYGSALDFDGTDDVVRIADAADLDLTRTFTIEAWVSPDAFSLYSPVLVKDDGAGTNGYLLSVNVGARKPGAILARNGTYAIPSGTSQLPTATWSHLALTSDGAYAYLYVDGELKGRVAAIEVPALATDLLIGHFSGTGAFDGRIDEVRLYDETLSQTQIQTDKDNRVQPPAPQEYTTSVLDTGASSERVASVPITTSGDPRVVYSLAVPSITAGELLRATANLEVTNTKTYNITDSVQVLLGSSATDTSGTAVTPWTSATQTPDMYHLTLPISGNYRATSSLGTQYLKVILKASSASARAGDTLTVQPNFGSLAATRYTPTDQQPISQPTHKLQPQIDPLPELVRTIPVDSTWQRVMTRRVSGLALDDVLDIAAQLEVQNTSGTTVQLEAQLTRSTQPSSGGSSASVATIDRLTSSMASTRISLTNAFKTSSIYPAMRYFNLRVRAVPVSGTPQPLTITQGSGKLDVLRMQPGPGDPNADLGEGTFEDDSSWDGSPDVSSIPFAVAGGSEKRVVASLALWGGVSKGTIIRARGLITGDVGATREATQVLTRLILADSATATTGETIGAFSGDKFSPSTQIHTSVKEGLYVIPRAESVAKYLNFVVYASQANPSGSMGVTNASVSFTRSRPTAPLDAGFEDGTLDSFFISDSHGRLSASTDVAREGRYSLLSNLDFSRSVPESNPFNLHNEVRPPDTRASSGYEGEDSWYGFSAYFPREGFTLGPDYGRFDGLIDEIRLYDQTLTESEIEADLAGNYGQTPAPVAAYGFDEGQGTIVTDSIGDNDGTISGSRWTSSGKYGSALDFDGIDDSVTIPDADELDLPDSFTMEAWVRPDVIGIREPILAKAETESNVGYRLSAAGGALFHTDYGVPTGIAGNAPTAYATVRGSGALSVGRWAHLALTSDGRTLSLYIDGELVGTATAVGVAATGSDLTIGASDMQGGGTIVLNTVFMQWHHSSEGLDCEISGGSPPIAFVAKYLYAGQFGVTETGDYLEARFNGGELDGDCNAAGGKGYVLAPLERDRWYDFVLHTRWTTEEGSPGNSVSEVWIDRQQGRLEQVLGNQTIPVTQPNLYWHGTPEIRNPITYMGFGIYRHVSGSQPQSKLYIDAVRRGESYAEVVPGQ